MVLKQLLSYLEHWLLRRIYSVTPIYKINFRQQKLKKNTSFLSDLLFCPSHCPVSLIGCIIFQRISDCVSLPVSLSVPCPDVGIPPTQFCFHGHTLCVSTFTLYLSLDSLLSSLHLFFMFISVEATR